MGTFEGTIDFAIQREQQAYIFYKTLAHIVTTEQMRAILMKFAEEELRHKEILSAMKGKEVKPADEKVPDLNISDDVSDVEPTPDISYKDALVIAMKKEIDSFRLYKDLAAITSNEELKNTFLALAQEEAKHKLRFETEYEKIVNE